MSLPLTGYRIGVTAARKVDEQVGLLERRGADVVWAPALSMDPNRVDDASLRAATEDVLARPVDLFLATTGIGMKAWFGAAESWGLLPDLLAALGDAEIIARGPEERRRAPPARAARAVGARLGVLRRRAGTPARPAARGPPDRRAGARPVAVDGRARAAPAGRRRHHGHRLPGRLGRRPRADVPARRPGRGPGAAGGHVHVGAGGRRDDGGGRLDRSPRRPGRRVPGRRRRVVRRSGHRRGVRDVGRARRSSRTGRGWPRWSSSSRPSCRPAPPAPRWRSPGTRCWCTARRCWSTASRPSCPPRPSPCCRACMVNPGHVVSRRDLLAALPSGTAGSEHAVEMAVARLRAALGTRTRADGRQARLPAGGALHEARDGRSRHPVGRRQRRGPRASPPRPVALLGLPATAAYVELCSPSLDEVLASSDEPTVVVPLLLSTGHHVRHDLPTSLASAARSRVA